MNTHMNFTDYLNSIPPEGETVLYVKQTLKLTPEGQPQYHSDGTPKVFFTPTLPAKYAPSLTSAWYACTASFITSRFEGCPSHAGRYAERVAFLMLDDVGTKSKTPPLEPTWKVETSPGNFQWGYTFRLDDQPAKGEFSAAVKAIAAAGYTDPGATNATRLFRIPGSINFKKGRGNFVTRLIELHPEREFTLAEICAAMGVTPGPNDSEYVGIDLADTGGDDVFAWLGGQGLVYSRPNGQGWAGIHCPNGGEHSDGNPEARYHPATRGFCCWHGHCTELNSRTFLDWVAQQGGPAHTPGLRDELVTQTMSSALSRLVPTDEYPDTAADAVAQVSRRDAARLEAKDWFTRYAYVQDGDFFYDLTERREISRKSFDATYRGTECQSIHKKMGRVQASIFYDENRLTMGGYTLAGLTYAAGDGKVCERAGLVYGNRWRNMRPALNVTGGDPQRWLDHVKVLVPLDLERDHLFNLMAFKLQNPSVKINHGLIHGGLEGSGKDTIYAPMIWGLGGTAGKNVHIVGAKAITDQWGYHLETELLVLNELHQPEARDRREMQNLLKPIAAAPPMELIINRKGLPPYFALNRLLVIAMSNKRDPFVLTSTDRRWFVIWSDNALMDTASSLAMWNWLKTGGGYEACVGWLLARDVSKFNPGAAPPFTDAKALMVESGYTSAEAHLVELISGRVGEFSRGAVCAPWGGLLDRLQSGAPSNIKLVQPALLQAFQDAGWKDMGRVMSKEHTTKRHLFCAPTYIDYPVSDLRRLAEPGASPNLTIVK